MQGMWTVDDSTRSFMVMDLFAYALAVNQIDLFNCVLPFSFGTESVYCLLVLEMFK